MPQSIGAWGQAALEILMRETNLARRMHRDSSNTFAQHHDRIVIQNPDRGRYEVELTEQLWSSIQVSDRETSRSFPEIIQYFIEPCMLNMARTLDMLILRAVYANSDSSHLPRLTRDSTSTIAQANRLLNNRTIPHDNRSLIMTPAAEAELLRYCGSEPCAGYFGFLPVLHCPSNDTNVPEGVNFAWHQDAIALVTRPVGNSREQHSTAGTHYGIACNDHLTLRVNMNYDIQRHATTIKFTVLAGIVILNPQGIMIFDE